MVTVFLIGVCIAVIVDHLTGVNPGGYIVPGYLALEVSEPLRLGFTLMTTIGVMGVLLLLERIMLLYGRGHLGMAILSGALLKSLLTGLSPILKIIPLGIWVIGYVIPGLMAHRCMKQGILRTLCAATIATGLTVLFSAALRGG